MSDIVGNKQIDQKDLFSLLDYNQDTGVFTWKNPTVSHIRSGDIAGSIDKKGYVRISIYKKAYMAHRLAWLYVYGCFPEKEIDHINGVKNDNRISNLRDVSHQKNLMNINKAYKNNKSGLLGVSKRFGRFHSVINAGDKRIYLGSFDTAELANLAYLEAKSKIHNIAFEDIK